MRILIGLAILLSLGALSCGKSEDHSAALTERQRDSIIATEFA